MPYPVFEAWAFEKNLQRDPEPRRTSATGYRDGKDCADSASHTVLLSRPIILLRGSSAQPSLEGAQATNLRDFLVIAKRPNQHVTGSVAVWSFSLKIRPGFDEHSYHSRVVS